MRILLRVYGDNEYVWKDATYKNERYYLTDPESGWETEVFETNIAAVEDHAGGDYVVCMNCGEVIPNTPEAIEAHFVEKESTRDCTNCRYLQFDSNRRNLSRTLVDQGNGVYTITENFESNLYCNSTYYRKRVEDVDFASTCTFYRCRQVGTRPPRDIFSNYPNAFDTAITVDTLIEHKYKADGKDGRFFLYDMKSRGTIKACVNSLGIVECFRVSSNGGKLYFYYSERYDRVFMDTGWDRNYVMSLPYWFRENKYEEAMKKIRALYEGANEE